MRPLQLLLASGNAHKAQEFAELLDPQILKVSAAPKKLEVPETGTTYFENALIKARAYYDAFKAPVLADDSGVEVEALMGQLGLNSANFGGPGLKDRQRAELLLEKMANVPDSKRTAVFTCILCIYLSPEEVFFFEGRMEGKIGKTYVGEHGFGYDPVFIPSKLGTEDSIAQHPEWKKLNCHRAIACQHALKFFKSFSCQA